ncbi:MAG: FAD-dependent oxidoreductase [Gemmataceae bacterium]
MESHPDVIVVGGGVIGLTTAWYLAGQGVQVTVVDQREPGQEASWAGAGILPPANLDKARDAREKLHALSFTLHADLAAALREETGLDTGFHVCGGVELPETDNSLATLPTEEWHGPGVEYVTVDRPWLARTFGDVSTEIHAGVYLPDMAQVRNPWHLKALLAGCLKRGVCLVPNFAVEQFHRTGSRVTGIEGPSGKLAGGQVLLSAGAWMGHLLRKVGYEASVFPIRGQMVLFNSQKPGFRPILLQGKRYLVTRGDGLVLAGSTEEDVGFDARCTEEGIAGLTRFALQLVPDLASATIEKTWAGLRPGCKRDVPLLGLAPGYENLFIAGGHFRAGLLLSPGTGLLLSQMVLGQPPAIPLEVFRP